jgi:quercetin dioxygenase-like cupin family protein
MNIIDINSLKLSGGSSAKFQGFNYEVNISFFVVNSPLGQGASKHRHPYEEIFVILDGKIEAIIGDSTNMIEAGKIVIIPPNTWHEFKNRSDHQVQMVNIHPVPKMIQEDWT